MQGHLDFWDTLLERHRWLLIDSCASGGRRNDLETMRRSVPLHYTDFGYGLHPVKLDFQQTMYEWLPVLQRDNGNPGTWPKPRRPASTPPKRTASPFIAHWLPCSGRP